jgi:hypothetical protein
VLEILPAESVGELSTVADADEAVGQDMEEESADEFTAVDAFDAPASAALVVLVSEEDVFVLSAYEPLVGDGDAMGVAAEIVEDLLGSGEGRLDMDDPLLEASLVEKLVEANGMLELADRVGKIDLGVTIGLFQGVEEGLLEDGGENLKGDEELGVGADPTVFVFGGGSGPLHDRVGMGMESSLRAPGV